MIRIQFWAHRCRNRCVRMCVAGWWANREHWLQWWNCLRVHFLIWVLLQDIYDLKCNSAIPNVSSASRWSITNHIFSKVHKWNVNNWHLDIDFNSEICGALYFWKFERSLIRWFRKLALFCRVQSSTDLLRSSKSSDTTS